MKKNILSALIIAICFFSCKKDKDNTPSCPTSVAGIAANYKLTKIELTSSTGTTDVSSTYLDDCKRNALYQLKADKTIIYTEQSTSCTDSGTGNWDVVNNKITTFGTPFNFDEATIKSWNCTTLLISSPFGSGTTLEFTFVKQ